MNDEYIRKGYSPYIFCFSFLLIFFLSTSPFTCFQVEYVVMEEKTMGAYDLIKIYCELITARMPVIESQKCVDFT